jgi:hypothetical protein
MAGQNPNNSTNDNRVIWEDGNWAVIDINDWPESIGRSKTRDAGDIQGCLGSSWEAGLAGVKPGASSYGQKKWVKVKLAELLNTPPAPKTIPQVVQPRMFKPLQDPKTPVAPPSPFMPKPYKTVPDWPFVCQTCGGRFVQLATSSIHELTEFDPMLKGACPGPVAAKKLTAARTPKMVVPKP